MIRALAIIGLLAAGRVQALTPLPECTPDGDERAAGIGDYSVQWHGAGFALYPAWDEDYRLILDDCKGQRRLVMQSVRKDDPNDNAMAQMAMSDAVLAALESNQRYTMGQIQAIARQAGAKTRMGKAEYVSCACDRYGDED
jgi:hypothetical protein